MSKASNKKLLNQFNEKIANKEQLDANFIAEVIQAVDERDVVTDLLVNNYQIQRASKIVSLPAIVLKKEYSHGINQDLYYTLTLSLLDDNKKPKYEYKDITISCNDTYYGQVEAGEVITYSYYEQVSYYEAPQPIVNTDKKTTKKSK